MIHRHLISFNPKVSIRSTPDRFRSHFRSNYRDPVLRESSAKAN